MRDKVIMIRLSDREHRAITRAAERESMQTATWARRELVRAAEKGAKK